MTPHKPKRLDAPNPFEADAQAFKFTFSTLEGQKTLAHLRQLFYDVDFSPDWSPERMAFQAGQHALMRYILDQVGE